MKPYYEADGIVIYHGDALDVLPRLGVASGGFVTDPPYTAAGGSTNGRSNDADTQFFRFWMSAALQAITASVRPNASGFLFCDWRTVGEVTAAMRMRGDRMRDAGWSVSQALVWDRECIGLGSPFRNSFEMIAFARGPLWQSDLPKNLPTVVRHRWPYSAHPFHGAEKPVGLCRQLVEWSVPAGDVVLDPFIGSGTTLLAALQSGRRAIGIEVEERYCEIAAKRLSQSVMDFGAVA